MTLVNMKKLLNEANKKGRGVGAFNVGNMEMVRGVIKAAEKTDTPVIMQLGEKRLYYSPLDLMAPMMVQAAKSASIDIAVHFDHGTDMENIKKALEYGFTSVMFDGSSLPFEENIDKTSKVTAIASEYGASVEAELGYVGNNADSSEADESEIDTQEKIEDRSRFTKPDEAALFCERTCIDALAVAIGNAHGNYTAAPQLAFDVLKQIKLATKVPLVLHGGTGITPDDFRRAIKCGIRKINIATANYDAAAAAAAKCVNRASAGGNKIGYFDLSEAEMRGTCDNVKEHITIFSGSGLSYRND